ncbi:MAG TPA: hypothetical protein VH186_22940 [Chloroflexia bacterium]|nr:hypothetical protein [Chloroflexia bacterium]
MTVESEAKPLAVEPEGVLIENLTVEGPRDKVFFRRRVPAEQIEQMELADGLGIFFRYDKERQKQILLNIARMPYGNVVLAHTPGGLITGYVSTHPVDSSERWDTLNQVSHVNSEGKLYVYEFGAIEVSRQWRGMGLSTRLMRAAFETDDWFEDKITVSVEFAWHWDYEEVGMSKFAYRNMLKKVIGSAGFERMDTDEPNVVMDSANMFMVRLGPKVPTEVQQRFFALLHKDNRWGF